MKKKTIIGIASMMLVALLMCACAGNVTPNTEPTPLPEQTPATDATDAPEATDMPEIRIYPPKVRAATMRLMKIIPR